MAQKMLDLSILGYIFILKHFDLGSSPILVRDLKQDTTYFWPWTFQSHIWQVLAWFHLISPNNCIRPNIEDHTIERFSSMPQGAGQKLLSGHKNDYKNLRQKVKNPHLYASFFFCNICDFFSCLNLRNF